MKIVLFSVWFIITCMILLSIMGGFFIPVIDDEKYPQFCWWDIPENLLKIKK